jgi:hypothetical protein
MTAVSFGPMILYTLVIWVRPRARRACSILVLRGFQQEQRLSLYKRVFPAVACYGKIVAIRNPTDRPLDDEMGPLQTSIMTDAEEHFVASSDWQLKILEFLRNVDIVVIDVSQFSESVRWELRASLAELPTLRVIPVMEATPRALQTAAEVAQIYSDHGVRLEDFGLVTYVSWRSIPLNFWKYWPFWFEKALHRRMRRIELATRI